MVMVPTCLAFGWGSSPGGLYHANDVTAGWQPSREAESRCHSAQRYTLMVSRDCGSFESDGQFPAILRAAWGTLHAEIFGVLGIHMVLRYVVSGGERILVVGASLAQGIPCLWPFRALLCMTRCRQQEVGEGHCNSRNRSTVQRPKLGSFMYYLWVYVLTYILVLWDRVSNCGAQAGLEPVTTHLCHSSAEVTGMTLCSAWTEPFKYGTGCIDHE